MGHALGLKHGHEADSSFEVSTSPDRDSMEFSIMTYRSYIDAPTDFYRNETWGYAQSLMMYDIRAIQHMYGANFNTNSGNTTYSFSTTTGEMFINGFGQGTPGDNRIFRTIWDGNGFDTYDFSNYNTNLSINLAPGGWSDLDVGGNNQRAQLGNTHFARGHVFNALQYNGDTRSLIENAIGGSGNDVIIGNDANNIISGGGGDDFLNGFGFSSSEYDTLSGGAGADIFVLGDASSGAFYQGFGFVTITDFNWVEGDQFQVFGSANDYTLTEFGSGIDINYQGDLIGHVENTNNVIIPNDFIFV